MPHTAQISLGTNLGDRHAHIHRALDALSNHPDIQLSRLSRIYETPAVGGPENQGAFFNSAAQIQTTLSPLELLEFLQQVESQFGRTRDVRWSERTLDLDLLFFDDQILDLPQLTVPHPRLAVRRFVLVPLAEIAPNTRDPVTGLTVNQILNRLLIRPSAFVLQLAHTRDAGSLFLQILHQTGALDLASASPDELANASPDRWLGLNLSQDPANPPNPQRSRSSSDPTFARRIASLDDSARPQSGPQAPPHPHDPTFVITDHARSHIPASPTQARPTISVPTLHVPPNSPRVVLAETLAACLASRIPCEPVDAPTCPDLIRPL